MKSFADFSFPTPLTVALQELKFETPTPVQAEAIPLILEGKDLLVTAQTGTGKTAAFALPLLSQMLLEQIKRPVLVITPTRELAEQIGRVLDQLTIKARRFKAAVIIGGTSYHTQIKALREKPMFVVGTPGRLLDQVELKNIDMSQFGHLVIDEADRLLDMGFSPQIDRLVKGMSNQRQTLLFSATLPDEIEGLARKYMRDPARVSVGGASQPVDLIDQEVVETLGGNKNETLLREIDKVAGSVIVFTRTKSRTERVATFLRDSGHTVTRIHGDRTQKQRSDALEEFRSGKARILVATDIAARGIDVANIGHVINYDLPLAPEDYIHRIGRTGRAGASGHSLAFVTPEDRFLWAKIYKLMYGRYPEGRPAPRSGKKPAGKMGGGPRGKSGKPQAKGRRSEEKPGQKAGPKSGSKFGQKHGQKPSQKKSFGSAPKPGQKSGQKTNQKTNQKAGNAPSNRMDRRNSKFGGRRPKR